VCTDTFERIREKEKLAEETDNVDTCVDEESSVKKRPVKLAPSHIIYCLATKVLFSVINS
jgi:hypothetical protein